MFDSFLVYLFGALVIVGMIFGVVRYAQVASDCWPEGQVVKVVEWGDGLACINTDGR